MANDSEWQHSQSLDPSSVWCWMLELEKITRCSDIESLKLVFVEVLQRHLPDTQIELILPLAFGFPPAEGKTRFEIRRDDLCFAVVDIEMTDCITPIILQRVCANVANHWFNLERCTQDVLTGLGNRTTLEEYMQHLFEYRSDRRVHTLGRTLVIIDLDYFKQINDNYGHLFGDEILVLLSGLMKKSFRTEDALFRYGGDEFMVVLNHIHFDEAEAAINRFCQMVGAYAFPQNLKVTLSIGYTEVDISLGRTINFSRADYALYYVKEHGRNGAQSYEALAAAGLTTQDQKGSGDVELF
ncbi:MAG: GGDEF domain-containing protein [Hahellaceae bacterium]|nr:GGDEF domain-containing protein [Hahellaceae bacterium]MCP5169300.1 GGDEF domain-containing protein [Hahellaceae bacterium]